MSQRLKLKALDAEDLQVVSAALQDSLVAVRDIAWMAQEKQFALVANRFRWEALPDDNGAWSRCHSILGFAEVSAVRHADMPLSEPDRILGLLAIESEEAEGGGVIIRLRFADGRMIRLEASRLLCHIEDVGEPWPTRFRPDHPLADATS
ncbi:MAG: DUF2948 family protein [Alphaproteobacteria bacterium]|nr:DUF2948 family protein [Alphaproteobacteria bacterium]MCW5738662.1 DUF2948 family protein [Alphaproteobacteria bacterium]